MQTREKIGKFKWHVRAWPDPTASIEFGKLRLTRFDTSGNKPRVELTITLSNGSSGFYEGTINKGLHQRPTTDEFHPESTACFWVLEPVDCV